MSTTQNLKGNISTTGTTLTLSSASSPTVLTHAGAATLTFPTGTDTLMAVTSTHTGITNKTFTALKITAGSNLDADSVGTLAIGPTNATDITIGRTGQTVTIAGNLTVDENFDVAQVQDDTFVIVEAGAETNSLNFDLVGSTGLMTIAPTHGEAVTITLPDPDTTSDSVPYLGTAQTWTGVQTFNSGTLVSTSAVLTTPTIAANSTLNSATAGTMAIGGTNTSTLSLGRSGQTQALLGNATVAGTLGVTGALTAASVNGLTVTTSTGTLTVSNGITLTADTTGTAAISTLANLGTTAINTSLISDTDNTDDLGTDAAEWKDVWTHTIKHGDAGTPALNISTESDNGDVIISPNGTGKLTVNSAIEAVGTDAYVKTASLTTTERDALTPADGQIIYNETTIGYQGYSNGAWGDIGGGSGSGELNYISNSSGANSLTTGWSDSGSDGELDIAGVTAGEPRDQLTGSGLEIKASAGTQTTSSYVYYDFTLDSIDVGRMMKLEFAMATTGTYNAGELEVYIADASSRGTALITPRTSAIPSSNGIFNTEFMTTTDTTLSLVFRATTNMTSAGGIIISDVIVGPGRTSSGAVVGSWEEYTPTFTNVTLGNGSVYGEKRRVGESLEFTFRLTLGSTSSVSSSIYIDQPDGLTWPTPSTSTIRGHVSITDSSTAANNTKGSVYNASGLLLMTSIGNSSNVNATNPFTFATGDVIWGTAIVPVVEWAGQGTMNALAQDNMSEWEAFTPTPTSGTFADDVDVAVTGHKRRVGDFLEVRINGTLSGVPGSGELRFDLPDNLNMPSTFQSGGASVPIGQALFYENGVTRTAGVIFPWDTGSIGSRFFSVSGTNVIQGTISTSAPFTWGSGDTFSLMFKVLIDEWAGSQSSLVGFTEVSQDFSGLVQSAGQLKGTNTNDAAAAGYVGEHIIETGGGGAAGATGVYVEIEQISLTAGDWDVWGAGVLASGGTAVTRGTAVISSVTASSSGSTNTGGFAEFDQVSGAVANTKFISPGVVRVSVASETTYYLNGSVSYASGTSPGWSSLSHLQARRVR